MFHPLSFKKKEESSLDFFEKKMGDGHRIAIITI